MDLDVVRLTSCCYYVTIMVRLRHVEVIYHELRLG